MGTISSKVAARISDGLKKLQPIVQSAKIRDVNESDTVVIITGIFEEILGYNRYTEITTEHSIRGTYCDLALSIEGKLKLLVEAKAVGTDLRENHVKQSVDYAANQGLDWVILTNAHIWRVYKIHFTKPIQNELVAEIDFLSLSPKAQGDVEMIYLLSKEGISKSSLDNYHIQKQATNRFLIGNLLTSDSIINGIRKELKQIHPDIKVTQEEIKDVLIAQVIKRELLEGEEANEARRRILKAQKRKEKALNQQPRIEAISTTDGDFLSEPPQGHAEV